MAVQVASLFAKISADTSALEKSLKGVKGDLTSTEKGFASFQSVAKASFVAIGLAATAAFAAVGAGMASTIKAAAKFEQDIADIGAVMNLTGKESADLQDHIMDLGLDPKLKVSATEASDAIMSLGTAGLNMTQIMGGASKATVQLSNSTGGDMARSAELLTDIMSQFNIEASDTGRVVDQVTGLTVASKFAFGDAALAIAQAGGMAGATGVEFEDFNAILGVTAANFSSGSDAGTSLKTFLTTLIPKSKEAAGMMRDLGLFTGQTGAEFEATQEKIAKLRKRIEELDPTSSKYSDNVNKLNAEINDLTKGLVAGGSAFFDQNGMMKSSEDIAQALQDAFGGLSDARKNDALATIFGNDAMRTAAGLIDSGTAGIVKMKEEIGKVDAEEIAAKRMDTFAGALEIASGVVETISISIGQKFLPVLRPLVEQFVEVATKHGPKLIDFFGRFAEKVAHLISQTMEWGQRVLPPLWDRLVQIGTAINTVTGMVMQALSPLTKIEGNFIKWHDVVAAVGILLMTAAIPAIAAFVAAMAPMVLLVAKVALVLAVMREAWETNFLGIQDIVGEALNFVSKFLNTHTSLWKGTWAKTLAFFTTNSKEAWTELSGTIVHKWSEWTSKVKHIVLTWVDVTERKLNGWILNTKNSFVNWVGIMIRDFGRWRDDMGQKIEQVLGYFIPQEWIQKGKDIVQGLWDGMKRIWANLRDWFTGVWGDLTDRFKRFFGIASPSTLFRTYGEDMMAGLREGIDAGSGQVFDSMDAMNHGIAGKLKAIDGLIDMSQSAMSQKAWDNLMKFYEEASKPTLPDWAKPGYVPPPSTMPPVLANPNSGAAAPSTTPVKPAVVPIDHIGNWFKKTVDSVIGFKFSGNTNILDTLKTTLTKTLDDYANNPNIVASGLVQKSIQQLLGGNLGGMTVGHVVSQLEGIVERARYEDQLDSTLDPQMERNNELLTILINELRNKNMTANFNLVSGGSYSDLVAHVSGMKT